MSDSVILNPPPIRTPLLDKNGIVTSPWLQWFRSLYTRVGGAEADLTVSEESPPDLSPVLLALQLELNDELRSLPPANPVPFDLFDTAPLFRSNDVADDSLSVVPLPQPPAAPYEDIGPSVVGLLEQIADLTTRVQALEQGIQV